MSKSSTRGYNTFPFDAEIVQRTLLLSRADFTITILHDTLHDDGVNYFANNRCARDLYQDFQSSCSKGCNAIDFFGRDFHDAIDEGIFLPGMLVPGGGGGNRVSETGRALVRASGTANWLPCDHRCRKDHQFREETRVLVESR